MNKSRNLTPENFRLMPTPEGTLRVEVLDILCCRQAVFRRLFPIHRPDQFISVSDGKEEIGIIEDLSAFDPDVCRLIRAELDFFYAVPEITEIELLNDEYGYYHWKTMTDRGPREFYVKGRSENVRVSPPNRVFITDIHNCRYQITDLSRLSRNSRYLLESVQ